MLDPFAITYLYFTAALSAASLSLASDADSKYPLQVLPPKAPAKYTNAFRKYRPSYHLTAPYNWLNDPCAPMFNGTHYHLFYQWSPYSYNWGNISWAHSSSADLIHWEDEPLAFGPDSSYDHLGIFTGSAIPNGLNGDWTIFYTGATYLPIGWSVPYDMSAEHQALATSSDGGITWTKYEGNPVIPDPPQGLNKTGFRDPFMLRSKHMTRLLRESARFPDLSFHRHDLSKLVYSIISGGDRDGERGGRLLLYGSTTFTEWDYIGDIFGIPGNMTLPGTHAAFGLNFELGNLFTFDEETYYITLGSEGGRQEDIHHNHWAIWVSGKLRADDKHGIRFVMENAGISDYGIYYAANSFHDPVKDRRVIIGWSNDEVESIREKQHWAGIIALPRQLFEKTIRHVSSASCKTIIPGSDLRIVSHSSNGCTVRTLGSRPVEEIRSLYDKRLVLPRLNQKFHIPLCKRSASNGHRYMQWLPFSGTTYELVVEFDVNHLANSHKFGRFGFMLRATKDLKEYTLVYFDWKKRRIGIDRSHSSAANRNLHHPHIDDGPFHLLKLNSDTSGRSSETRYETLRFHIFMDNSIIEVYVNERFAITDRVYPSQPKQAIHAGYFTNMNSLDPDNLFTFKDAKVFSMKGVQVPDRPSQSMAKPVFHPSNHLYTDKWICF